MNFGRAIRSIAAARCLHLRDVAGRVNISEVSLSRICSQEQGVSLWTLERIAAALETPLYLLVLLASDVEDLGDDTTAAVLGSQLLELLVDRRRRRT